MMIAGSAGMIGALVASAQSPDESGIAYSCEVFIEPEQQQDCVRRLPGRPARDGKTDQSIVARPSQPDEHTLEKRREAFDAFYRNVHGYNSGVMNYEHRSDWPMNLSTMLREQKERSARIRD